MQKHAVVEKSQNVEVVESFLKAFCTCLDKAKSAPKEADLDKYLAKNFQIRRNGHFQAKSASEYLARLNTLRETYSGCAIAPAQTVGADNKVAVQFNAVFAEGSEKTEYLIIAIATFENGKMAHWEEIAHKKA